MEYLNIGFELRILFSSQRNYVYANNNFAGDETLLEYLPDLAPTPPSFKHAFLWRKWDGIQLCQTKADGSLGAFCNDAVQLIEYLYENQIKTKWFVLSEREDGITNAYVGFAFEDAKAAAVVRLMFF